MPKSWEPKLEPRRDDESDVEAHAQEAPAEEKEDEADVEAHGPKLGAPKSSPKL